MISSLKPQRWSQLGSTETVVSCVSPCFFELQSSMVAFTGWVASPKAVTDCRVCTELRSAFFDFLFCRLLTCVNAALLLSSQSSWGWRKYEVRPAVRVSAFYILQCSDTGNWLSCGITPYSTQNRSFRRRPSQPISWLSTEKWKQTQQKQTCIRNKIYYSIKLIPKKLKPGLVDSYNIRPGNGEGLFWFWRFINLYASTFCSETSMELSNLSAETVKWHVGSIHRVFPWKPQRTNGYATTMKL